MCQGFSHFQVFFASFCIGQISHQQHKGLTNGLSARGPLSTDLKKVQYFQNISFILEGILTSLEIFLSIDHDFDIV